MEEASSGVVKEVAELALEAEGMAAVEGEGVEGDAPLGRVPGMGASLSAGCLDGKTMLGGRLGLPSSAWACKSSLKPISPRFDGKGPASGRDSAGAVEVKEEDESVDAMIKIESSKTM